MRLYIIIFLLFIAGCSQRKELPDLQTEKLRIPTVDISKDTLRHSVVAQGTPMIRQAHPSLSLSPDNKMLISMWTIGHGGYCGPLAISKDGGKKWTQLTNIPNNWRENYNCPPLYVVTDPNSEKKQLITYAHCRGIMTYAVSDDGINWSEFYDCPRTDASTPLINGGMPFTSVIPIRNGKALLGVANLTGPYVDLAVGGTNIIGQSYSYDGGKSWTSWRTILDLDGTREPCEPFIIRSPNRKQMMMLLRENNHAFTSWMMLSNDEGENWTSPVRIGAEVTFDRHIAKYLPDGRLIVVGRDVAQMSPAHQHLSAWVGTYEDLLNGKPGQYRIKIFHSYHGSVEYPGIEILDDGTIVVVTSLSYRPGENYSVVCTRFNINETDLLFKNKKFLAIKTTTIPTVDLSSEKTRQKVLFSGVGKDRPGFSYSFLNTSSGQISVIWEKGNDGPTEMMISSSDFGRSWGHLESLPADWSETKGHPKVYNLLNGGFITFTRKKELLYFATSKDGKSWTSFKEAKCLDGTVLSSDYQTPSACISSKDGKSLTIFSTIRKPGDLGRFNIQGKSIYNTVIVCSKSKDNGVSWTPWTIVFDPGVPHLPSHPSIIVSPNEEEWLLLCSDQYKSANSWFMTTKDCGKTWSEPQQITNNLTLDGYNSRYSSDGRLVIVGRDDRSGSQSRYCTVAWVGKYDDIKKKLGGEYRICLQRSYNACKNAYSIGFPGLEILPDGSFIVTNTIATSLNRSFEVVSSIFSLAETDYLIYGHKN